MSLTVRDFTGPAESWDEFGSRMPGSTHCHRHGWNDVIGSVFGHECMRLAAYEGAELRGILPLVRVKSALFGHYLVSVPFLNYGGPIGSADAVRALGHHASELARAGNVKLLELRSRIEQPVDLPVSHRKLTVVLDLPARSDELFKSFPAKLRSQVRRPAKEGVTIRFGADQVPAFYAVFSRHMRDLGTPVMPRRFFETVARSFPEDSWFGVAYIGDEPIACGAGFVWQGEFELTWASSLSAFNRLSPNMGLYWAFMERSVDAGLRRFNFGRCSRGSGTHRFKLQWGGRDEELWWYQQALGRATAATPSPDDGAYAWGPRLWKRLPLGVANWLGPRIVRSIP